MRLNKIQNGVWTGYHKQEAASEVRVSMFVNAIEPQYLVKLNEMSVGYCSQNSLSVIAHLHKQQVKVTNVEKWPTPRLLNSLRWTTRTYPSQHMR